MSKLAYVGWLWCVGNHFLFWFSKFYLMGDSISQGPGRKQMAHSNWPFRGCFIKGTFYKGMGRAQ